MKFATNLNLKGHQFFLTHPVQRTDLVSDNSCTAKIMHFNFHLELDFVLDQRPSNCKNACNAASLNFNSISFFTHPVLCTVY